MGRKLWLMAVGVWSCGWVVVGGASDDSLAAVPQGLDGWLGLELEVGLGLGYMVDPWVIYFRHRLGGLPTPT